MKIKNNLFVFVFALCLITKGYSQSTLSAEGFYYKLKEKPNNYILDVSDSASYQGSIFNFSVWFPSKANLITFADTADRDVPVFVFCAEGKRSLSVMGFLIEKGFIEIYNLKKGINQWPKKWNDSEHLMHKIAD